MRCVASPPQSSNSDPASVSSQNPAAARFGCGTEVPEPRTMSSIRKAKLKTENWKVQIGVAAAVQIAYACALAIQKTKPPATAGGSDRNQMTVKSDRWIRRM